MMKIENNQLKEENKEATAQRDTLENGLIEAAIDFEANSERFDDAFRLAENHARYKLPDVHLKFALHLEDDNRFKEAEEEFIKANKP